MDLETRAVGSDALAAEVAQFFGLPAPAGWCDLGGSWTTNLRLDYPAGPVVARVHQGSTSAPRLAAVQTARRAVGAAGIPTVPSMSTPDGQTVVTLASGRLAEMEPFREWDGRMSSVSLLQRGFPTLARVHDVLRTATLPPAARTVRYANHIFSAEAAATTRRGAERIRSWRLPALTEFAEQVEAHIDAVDAAEKPLRDKQLSQIVHGDFWDNNVLFGDGKLVALLDFDFMAERPRIDDLALTAYFFLLQKGNALPSDADPGHIRSFVDAYDAAAEIPFSAAERAALPLAIARQPAWSVGRWVLELDEPDAIAHATDAAAELPVAQAVLADLDRWQAALA